MSVIKQYRAFKADLCGFAEVPFDEFRKSVLPLRTKREWDEDMTEYATSLLNAGAGRAIQRLCGMKHPAAAKLLGEAELKADPMTKAELDEHMRALTKSCLAGGWPPERFVAFAMYLDSDMTPKQMAERDREAHRRRAEEAKASGSLWAQAKADSEADAGDAEPAPERDRFAEMYRVASPAFKRAVNEHLALAAETARPR
jgi:hypothetical protein